MCFSNADLDLHHWKRSCGPRTAVVSRPPASRPTCILAPVLQAATFTRDTERLQANLEKIRSEIR